MEVLRRQLEEHRSDATDQGVAQIGTRFSVMICSAGEAHNPMSVAVYLSIHVRTQKVNIRCIYTLYAVVMHHGLPE